MKKKAKQKLSDTRNIKPQARKLNPFEVHINRKKYDILGMKSKSERGLPGISRAKSLKKRKGTLLQEYKLKDKKNTFLDRRIGEKNRAMTAEDKVLARYTAERMKFHTEKSIYNLGDDEELTHHGQTLTEIEKFDNPRSEDEEEDEDGKLNSDFVSDAHFGGGIFKKIDGESKSRKDLIDQLIAESIKRKAEKQKLRQQTLDLTQKLDSEWKELLPLVTASKKSKSDVESADKKDDKFANYDVMSKKLKFEARGKPSDRLKSEEEIAKEEKERLEKLEQERIQRMLGETHVKTIKHRSADDLDDGFDLNNESMPILTYKNGVLNIEGNEDDSDYDNDTLNVNSDGKEKGENEEDEEEMDVDAKEENTEDVSDDENSESSDSDNLSDLKGSDEEEDDEGPENSPENATNENSTAAEEVKEKSNKMSKIKDKEAEKFAEEKESALESARNELPYTFEIPKEYDKFEELLKNYNPDFQSVIIERMIKCHHPSLKENFKDDLDLLYTFMLQHLHDCASDEYSKINCFKILDRLAPWFYDLAQWNPQNCSSGLTDVIKEKYQDFIRNPKIYPSLDTLIFLKLVSILFPTSDYRHPVVTPSLIFMQQILFECRVRSSVDLSRGLFIATLLLEYTSLSKKLVPEAINFLRRVLRLAHPINADIPNEPPFDLKSNTFSLLPSDKSSDVNPTKLSVSDLILENESEEFKVNSISLAINLLSRFCDYWSDDQPAILIFEPFLRLLDVCEYRKNLKKEVEGVLGKISKLRDKNLRMLVLEKKKPMPLRLYEPKIEPIYSLKNFRPANKKKAERAKLMHKYKMEMKGALREIRRDRSFIAKLKFKETVKSDLERHQKVREIFGSAAQQAGEINKLQRKKKK